MQKPYVFWRKTALTAEKKDKEGRYFRDLGRESNPRPPGARENAKKMKNQTRILCFVHFDRRPYHPR